ncbi:MAG: PqqD family peptide modification chaperone [Candidatus Omnitrophota bacterium]|nr:PqqD family peptide modification chaperone [Candidatus Omnitrophota bacterium]
MRLTDYLSSNHSLLVSVIIPVYNGNKTLCSCLDSLMQLNFPKEDREIIVVDNHSTDNTKEIISQYPVKYVFEPKRGRGKARNAGIRASLGKYIAFTDADCVVDKLWLKNLIKGFTSDTVAGCGGEVSSCEPKTLIEKYYHYRNIYSQKNGLIKPRAILQRIATYNAIYRRQVLEEVGLFDSLFITNEDVDLSWRIFLKGYQLNYVPEAKVYHKYRDRLSDFFKQFFEYGYTRSYLLQKHKYSIKKPVVSFNDGISFFLIQLKTIKSLFMTIFAKNNISEKGFFILDMVRETALLLGRIYGLIGLRLGIVKIPTASFSLNNKLIWGIVNEKAVVSKPSSDFYYTLDEIGTKIWSLLLEAKKIPDIVDTIANDFEADKEEIKAHLMDFIDELKKEDLLKH